MTIRIGKKFFIIAALIIAAVAGAYGYYHFYYMRTPCLLYTSPSPRDTR